MKRVINIGWVLGVLILVSGCELLEREFTPVCDDNAAWALVDNVHALTDDTFATFDQIASLISQLDLNNSLINDTAWLNEVETQVQHILSYNTRAEQLSAPRQEFRIFIDLFHSAYGEFAQAIQLWWDGLSMQNQLSIDEGLDLLDLGHMSLNLAADELERVMADCIIDLPPDER